MVVSKLRISSPLEAGRSILDAYNLPPKLCDALDHISSKLSSKGVNVKLAVALRDYQLPTLTIIPSDLHSAGVYASQPSTPGSPPPAPASAVSSRFGFSNAISGLRQRLAGHVPTNLPLGSGSASVSVSGSTLTSPTNSAPYTPMTPMSPPPMSACTSTTFTTATDSTSPHGPCILGIRLIQTEKLDAKTSRMLHHVMNKARAKFGITQDILPQIAAPDACGLTDSIIRRSINQDEQLYTSKGLTLISLDRCYTFKSALSSYSRTGSQMRLEDAVDELRRLYLANGGRKVSHGDVLRSYDWLSVSKQALADVDIMYRRAYGGAEGFGAIEGLSSVHTEMDVSNNSQTSLPHRFGRLDFGVKMTSQIWSEAEKCLEATLEKDFESSQSLEPHRLWHEESESDEEYNLPSWEDKDEVLHVVDSRTATPSLKRNSTPRALALPGRTITPRALALQSNPPMAMMPMPMRMPTTSHMPVSSPSPVPTPVPTIMEAVTPVAAPQAPLSIVVRPPSTCPPPAPTCERPPATILSRTPPPRSMATQPKLHLVIPPSGASSPANSAATEKRVPLPKLQTSFSSNQEKAPRAGVKANRLVAHALDIVETPCTAYPMGNSGAMPFLGPAASREFLPPPAADHHNHVPSPTSAIARNFYRLPTGSAATLLIPPSTDSFSGPNIGAPSGSPYLAWPPNPSIAQLLSPTASHLSISTIGGPAIGPMTPNGADDISPITRGEWGHLFAGSAFLNARTVAVTTFQDV